MRSLLTVSHANSGRVMLCGATCNKVPISSNLRPVLALNGLWTAIRSSNAVFVRDGPDWNTWRMIPSESESVKDGELEFTKLLYSAKMQDRWSRASLFYAGAQ